MNCSRQAWKLLFKEGYLLRPHPTMTLLVRQAKSQLWLENCFRIHWLTPEWLTSAYYENICLSIGSPFFQNSQDRVYSLIASLACMKLWVISMHGDPCLKLQHQEVEAEGYGVQDHPQLHSELEISVGYIRLWKKKNSLLALSLNIKLLGVL